MAHGDPSEGWILCLWAEAHQDPWVTGLEPILFSRYQGEVGGIMPFWVLVGLMSIYDSETLTTIHCTPCGVG